MSDFGLGDCCEADVIERLYWHGFIPRRIIEGYVPRKPLAMSWTGSERQRKEQGQCKPPVYAPRFTPRFRIPAGTELSVCAVSDSRMQWQRHVTKRELAFERYEKHDSGAYVFRELGYFILVRASKVTHRSRDGAARTPSE